MSDECCGVDEPHRGNRATKTASTQLISVSSGPTATGDACCGPVDPTTELSTPEGDACCGPSEPRRDEHEDMPPWWRDPSLALPAASGLLWAAGLILEWTGLEVLALVVFALGLAAGAWTFVPGTLRRLFTARGRGRLGVGLLMTIAAAGAVLLGHVGEAAALAFLFALAETLEDRAMDRAKETLRALLSLVPQTARVSRMSGTVDVPVAELRELDLLVVGAGERVATDGVVAEGRSSIDASALTGESIPVEVGPGDPVSAGAVNGSGSLLVEATADGRDNSLTQIVALVEQAHARKGEKARLADRIARPLVPAVLVAAVVVALFGFLVVDPSTWIERALVVLVAASPCAMAIAVPVTVISAIGSASKFGVVVKSGAAFEQLGTIRMVAFDKTGTLTQGSPQVTDVRTVAGTSRDDVLAWAAAVEATSTHPLAAAISAAAHDVPAAEEVNEEAGHGLAGRVDGRAIRVGSPRWLDPAGLRTDADELTEAGMTVVVVEADGEAAGLIGVRDELRPEAAETVRMLRDQGIGTAMLTGDDSRTARPGTGSGHRRRPRRAAPSRQGDRDHGADVSPTDCDGRRRHQRRTRAGHGHRRHRDGSHGLCRRRGVGRHRLYRPRPALDPRRPRPCAARAENHDGQHRSRADDHRRPVPARPVRRAGTGRRPPRPRGRRGRRHPQRRARRAPPGCSADG